MLLGIVAFIWSNNRSGNKVATSLAGTVSQLAGGFDSMRQQIDERDRKEDARHDSLMTMLNTSVSALNQVAEQTQILKGEVIAMRADNAKFAALEKRLDEKDRRIDELEDKSIRQDQQLEDQALEIGQLRESNAALNSILQTERTARIQAEQKLDTLQKAFDRYKQQAVIEREGVDHDAVPQHSE